MRTIVHSSLPLSNIFHSEPTPEQIFAEIVQTIDFSKTQEEQLQVEEPAAEVTPKKREKNPLDLFRLVYVDTIDHFLGY